MPQQQDSEARGTVASPANPRDRRPGGGFTLVFTAVVFVAALFLTAFVSPWWGVLSVLLAANYVAPQFVRMVNEGPSPKPVILIAAILLVTLASLMLGLAPLFL